MIKYFIILIFLFSCTEVIVEDISDAIVSLIAPSDSIVTTHKLQNFIWEEVQGAENYRFSIAKPSFDSVELMILDTLIPFTNIQFNLDSGRYQWRVRAQNSAYFGAYFTRTLTIR